MENKTETKTEKETNKERKKNRINYSSSLTTKLQFNVQIIFQCNQKTIPTNHACRVEIVWQFPNLALSNYAFCRGTIRVTWLTFRLLADTSILPNLPDVAGLSLEQVKR